MKTINVLVTYYFPKSGFIKNTHHTYTITVELSENKENRWYKHYPIVPGEIEYQISKVVDKDLLKSMDCFEILPDYQSY